jgi:hypothetical protein
MEWLVLESIRFDEAHEATAPLELSGEAQEPACPDDARKVPKNLEQSAEAQASAQPTLEMLNTGSCHGDAHRQHDSGLFTRTTGVGCLSLQPGGFV